MPGFLERWINILPRLSCLVKRRIFRTRELQDVLPEHNEGINIVPQILTKKPEEFIKTARELQKMGYEEMNLNAGCPSKTVVSKRKRIRGSAGSG